MGNNDVGSFFKIMSDASLDGLLILKGNQIIAVNHRAEKMFGLPKAKLTQKTLHELINPSNPEAFNRSLKKDETNFTEIYSVNENSEELLLEIHIKQLSSPYKGYTSVALRDASRRKKMERALIRSEQEYKNLFHDSKDAIYISSRSGHILDVNEAAITLFGYSRDELLQLDVHELYEDPHDRTLFQMEIEIHGAVMDYELQLRRKDNIVLDCLLSSSIRRDPEGEIIGYQGIIRDITAIKKAQEFKKAKEVAEQSVKMKQQFLANMSHEIRTPLHAVFGMTNLLLQSNPSEQQFDYLQVIKNSTDHLLVLINDILDFSKIEAGKIQFNLSPFRLRRLIDSLSNTLQFKLDQKNLELDCQIESKVPDELAGDEVRLNQVLINLFTNAIKFTESGKITLTVKVLNSTVNGVTLSFTVSDTGIGIPADQLENIFGSFNQVHNSKTKKSEGTGLGLAITKKLIDMQGGSISVKSSEGEGSSFNFILKFAIGQSLSLQKPESMDIRSTPGKVRILIAEDNRVNQIVIIETLKKWDNLIEVVLAENGLEAIENLQDGDFHLIIMDVQMPKMNGYDAAEYIRGHFPDGKNNIPILAMTAYATTGEADECLKHGMDDFISKPFDPNLLFDKIQQLLEKNKSGSWSNTSPKKIPKQVGTNSEKIGNDQLVDLSYLTTLAQGDESVMENMLDSLIEETPAELHKMDQIIRDKNWKRLGAVAHKFKSTGTFLGNKKLESDIKQLEELAQSDGNTEDIPLLFKRIENICEKACKILQNKMQKT